jgi:DNA ligase-1
MKDFANLFLSLDQTNKTNSKVALLKNYFEKASDEDKLWTIALFAGRKPKKPVNTALLKSWAMEYAGIEPWLFEECYHVAGDLAETIALLLPHSDSGVQKSLTWWIHFIQEVAAKEEHEKKQAIIASWSELSQQERFVFNKIITGSFRIGVSQSLMVVALSSYTKLDKTVISHRIMGNWDPFSISFHDLLYGSSELDDVSRPYPFFLAYPIENTPEKLGDPAEWQAEWKWDGIRSQLIRRGNAVFIWSRGEELITEKFPEIYEIGKSLPDGTVLDGEILPYKNGRPLPFNVLQTRIGRKTLTPKILSAAPVVFIVYDVMEWEGADIRYRELSERRRLIIELVNTLAMGNFILSSEVIFSDWKSLGAARLLSRNNLAEGFMIKRKSSPYQVGRKRGDWWKWKIDPLSIDAVLIYAQKGHGRRADLYSDYTFAVWHGETLVPFAKAYSGLTDEEMRRVDYFIKRNIREKFGPVRTVAPELVFEIAFEGIQKSARHKCGIAVRFPRILRWRHDKKPSEADTLENLTGLLESYQNADASTTTEFLDE